MNATPPTSLASKCDRLEAAVDNERNRAAFYKALAERLAEELAETRRVPVKHSVHA